MKSPCSVKRPRPPKEIKSEVLQKNICSIADLWLVGPPRGDLHHSGSTLPKEFSSNWLPVSPGIHLYKWLSLQKNYGLVAPLILAVQAATTAAHWL